MSRSLLKIARLIEWDGATTSPAFEKLAADIANLLGPPSQPTAKSQQPSTAEAPGAEAEAVGPSSAVATPVPARGRWLPPQNRNGAWAAGSAILVVLLAVGLYLGAGGYLGTSREETVEQPQPTRASAPESALRLNAVLDVGKEPLTSGVAYEVFESTADAEGHRERVAVSAPYKGPPRFSLPAGRYLVSATHGTARASTELEIRPAELTIQRLNLNAGILRLSSCLAAGGDPQSSGVAYEVLDSVADAEGTRRRVTASPDYGGAPRFPLSAGRYVVTATHGTAFTSVEVEVKAGEVTQQVLVLGAGILRLGIVLADGSSPLTTGVAYEVLTVSVDAEGRRNRVTGSPHYEGPPRFPCPRATTW